MLNDWETPRHKFKKKMRKPKLVSLINQKMESKIQIQTSIKQLDGAGLKHRIHNKFENRQIQ